MILGLAYFALTIGLGWRACQAVDAARWLRDAALPGAARPHAAPVLAALWLVTGLLLMGWGTYLLAYAMRDTFTAALTAMLLAAGAVAWPGLAKKRAPELRFDWRRLPRALAPVEWATLALALGAAAALMWGTLSGGEGRILAGPTISSDLFAHTAVIRSFSAGQNFPTEYPTHPAGSIRYHFLFQFYAAALETLGLPFSIAFNLPSAAALAAMLVLLSAWAVCLTGRRGAGALAVLLALLPPLSPGHLVRALASPAPLRELWQSRAFTGWTFQEPWGLWSSLNIFANQRHLALGLAVLLAALLGTLPAVRAFQRAVAGAPWWEFTARTVYRREAWLPAAPGLDWRSALFLGLLLGLTGFWNGSCVIATLVVLAWTGLCAHQRLGFALIAALTVGLATLQSRFFVPEGGAVQLAWRPGFLAKSPAWPDMAIYYAQVLGLAVPAAWLALAVAPRRAGICLLAPGWLLPTALASLCALTVDVTVNHKFVLISYLLFTPAIGAACAAGLARRPWLTGLGLAVVIAPGLTLSLVLANNARAKWDLSPPAGEPLRAWIASHVPPDAVTLTAADGINAFLLSGRKIYNGWPYFAWSAGYDTAGRQKKAEAIYGARSPEEVAALARAAGIRFIVVNDAVRATMHPHLEALHAAPRALDEVWRTATETIYEVVWRTATETLHEEPGAHRTSTSAASFPSGGQTVEPVRILRRETMPTPF